MGGAFAPRLPPCPRRGRRARRRRGPRGAGLRGVPPPPYCPYFPASRPAARRAARPHVLATVPEVAAALDPSAPAVLVDPLPPHRRGARTPGPGVTVGPATALRRDGGPSTRPQRGHGLRAAAMPPAALTGCRRPRTRRAPVRRRPRPPVRRCHGVPPRPGGRRVRGSPRAPVRSRAVVRATGRGHFRAEELAARAGADRRGRRIEAVGRPSGAPPSSPWRQTRPRPGPRCRLPSGPPSTSGPQRGCAPQRSRCGPPDRGPPHLPCRHRGCGVPWPPLLGAGSKASARALRPLLPRPPGRGCPRHHVAAAEAPLGAPDSAASPLMRPGPRAAPSTSCAVTVRRRSGG